MQYEDNAEAVRALAYEIWERNGRPQGREHEHWAEANRIYAERNPRKRNNVIALPRWDRRTAESQEAAAMRMALYSPEPFCTDLFGKTG